MKIIFRNMTGVSPGTDPRMLDGRFAVKATNCWFENGGVRGIEGVSSVVATGRTGVKTIYRFGQAASTPTLHWFSSTSEVDFVKVPIGGDTVERTIIVGSGAPRYTDATVATAASPYPTTTKPLGVPNPTTGPSLALSGVSTAGLERRAYGFTFVSTDGDESALSPVTVISAGVGQGVVLSGLQTTASNTIPLQSKRIYRATAGVYLRVAQILATDVTYTDNVASDALGGACPSLTWDVPVASMKGACAGANGIVAGYSGYDLYFCEPYRAAAWPDEYNLVANYPIVGLGFWGQTFGVLTTGAPCLVSGVSPSNMSMREVPGPPCVSRKSIASADSGIVYAGPDGLCGLGVSGANVLTEKVFDRTTWRALKPETIVGEVHNNRYIGTYTVASVVRGFYFDLRDGTWVDLPDLTATAFYTDTVTAALYACVNDQVVLFRGSPTRLTYEWESKPVVGALMDFVAARVEGDYPVTLSVYADGALRTTQTVTSGEPFRIAAGLARVWAIKVSGNPVRAVGLATNMVELQSI
jgi:hypothetical protein